MRELLAFIVKDLKLTADSVMDALQLLIDRGYVEGEITDEVNEEIIELVDLLVLPENRKIRIFQSVLVALIVLKWMEVNGRGLSYSGPFHSLYEALEVDVTISNGKFTIGE